MADYCQLCPRLTRCVQPHGPAPARFMAIGEAPGKTEDATGIPFTGQTGEEWDRTYLPLAGLRRSEVFVTNVRQCRPPMNRKPSEKEIQVCGTHHLPNELAAVRPEIVFLMGATACSLIPDINLEVQHGIPMRGGLFGKEYMIVPMFHPALGLHDTGAMTEILEDWEGLREWIEDGRSTRWPSDSGETDYQLAKSPHDLREYFLKYPELGLIGGDTESHNGEPWSIQVSTKPGTGRMVLLNDKAMVKDLGGWINAATGSFGEQTLCLHNAPADLDIFEMASGFKFTSYRDTMQEAYQLGNLPQGLKALGYRLCGVRMKSWEEVVGEASRVKLMEWMMDRIEEEAGQPIVEQKQLKTRVKVIEKPNGVESALRRILAHTVESTTYDPWERLDGLGLVGMPMKGIGHCRLKDAVQYGCRDADITLRVALRLSQLRREAEEKWNVQPEDIDQ